MILVVVFMVLSVFDFFLLVCAWLEWLIAALPFELSQILLNPILLGLRVWAKTVVIQNGG